ncbi:hypothetical protein PSU4_48070 [Pseudonocardia sulfidoxydans NBRC 16205]|uniref:Histidine kinase/HSP90-like ATPase domain-containing protein n=1 Tax=Pseudonocardia sulfidoxydans NBRC 16205 TaxID=1223511 RepID=A0A511DNJ7_9PSEU|nr:ATP-binding protein [Pseudonocardia sulfidoxydans]GEL25853.1 hypothetical protein PSU4_48070 [Pseudonocardia sulfidoxydans NBRC 16205]
MHRSDPPAVRRSGPTLEVWIARPAELARLREALRLVAAHRHLPEEDVARLLVAVGEVLGAALLAGRAPVRVRCSWASSLRVRLDVAAQGPGCPFRPPDGPDAGATRAGVRVAHELVTVRDVCSDHGHSTWMWATTSPR